MSAQIIRLSVVRKRGRKVTKGPKASVSVIYDSGEVSSLIGPLGTLEQEMDRLNFLVMQSRARHVEEQAQQEAWIERSSNVKRWPETARVRSEALVGALKEGGDDEEPEIEPEIAEARRKFLDDVRARRDEILAGAGHVTK